LTNIIFQLGEEFWIELVDVPTANVNAGGFANVTFTLVKGGFWMGATVCMDDSVVAADSPLLKMTVQNGAAHLIIGDKISAVRVRKTNGSGTNRSFGGYVMLFMRGRAI